MKALLTTVALFAATLVSGVASAQIGTTYCTANANSTGSTSQISATGSTTVTLNDVTLGCDSLPANAFGYFITSPLQGFTANPGGSAGNLCLGGGVSGYAGNVLSSGTAGAVSMAIDLSAVPSPMGSTVVLPGDTVNFQFWHRDAAVTGATSNYSEGIEIQFDSAVPVPTMVPIARGSFSMGSNAAGGPPYYGGPNEQPVHSVTISQDFWMGATEVTQVEYQALMGINPSWSLGSTLPVERVSWHDARQYCAALTAQQTAAGLVPAGFEYRLPTEAEWEYACRAGTTTEFNVGASLMCGQARFWRIYHSNNSCYSGSGYTVAVGSYAPNAWGLYDMHGNVWEWSLDTYSVYTGAAQTDPFVTGGWWPFIRVLRGGEWGGYSYYCRSAYRFPYGPNYRGRDSGFRVVLAPVLVP